MLRRLYKKRNKRLSVRRKLWRKNEVIRIDIDGVISNEMVHELIIPAIRKAVESRDKILIR